MIGQLPKYVLLNFVSQWLRIDDVGRVDTALCQHSTRNAFLCNFCDCELSFDSFASQKSQLSLLKWVTKRNLQVTRLCLVEKSADKPSIKSVVENHSFSKLVHLTLGCGFGYRWFERL